MEINLSNQQKKNSFRYTEDIVLNALNAIASFKDASVKFGILYSTLHYKSSGKNPRERKIGPKTYLTGKEQECLVQ